MASPDGTAEKFESAVGNGDFAAACDLLTPVAAEDVESRSGESCPDAFQGLGIPSASRIKLTEAWGRAAIVEFDGDTLFLTRTGESWAVRAAGCSPVADAPYDCIVEGG
jgi:hypothetical protein